MKWLRLKWQTELGKEGIAVEHVNDTQHAHKHTNIRLYINYAKQEHLESLFYLWKRSNTFPASPLPSSTFSCTTFFPFHEEKRKNFALSCRILHWSQLHSSSPNILSPFPFFTFLLLSVRFLCALSIWRDFLTVSIHWAFHVNVATNVITRCHIWPCD